MSAWDFHPFVGPFREAMGYADDASVGAQGGDAPYASWGDKLGFGSMYVCPECGGDMDDPDPVCPSCGCVTSGNFT